MYETGGRTEATVVEPVWARWLFTTVLAGVTVTCLIRLVIAYRGRRMPGGPERHDDVAQAVMGVSMIAMVLSWTDVLPTSLWVTIFGAQAVAFGVLLLRRPAGAPVGGRENWDYTHHVVASVAMVYMIVALTGPAIRAMSMRGMSGTVPSPLTGAFGMYFLIYAGWSLLRAAGVRGVVPAAAGAGGPPAVLTRPMVVEGCRALMGGSMAYLLLAS
jgi:hypothetical protein